MSITNFINSETGTIVQGVNGIRLCQESWMTERAGKRSIRCKQDELQAAKERVREEKMRSRCNTD